MTGRIGAVRKASARVAVLVLVLGSTVGAVGAAAGGSTKIAATTVAPYVDMAGPNLTALDRAITNGGLTAFTAAFVIGKKCTPVWDDNTPVATNTAIADRIAAARAEGAEPIISFGGQAGKDLARSCTDENKVVAGYQAVIDQFGVTNVDFDVEGVALKNPPALARRFAAIKDLETANRDLIVSVTLPVGPSGLLKTGVKFLQQAKALGVTIDVVNIMAMDYGDARDMGAAAMSAAEGTLAQLQAITPGSSYDDLGVTPMIGVNDTAVEVFSAKNAKTLVKFAQQHGLGRLGFWSINRDRKCATSGPPAHDDCSGIAQKPGAFAKAFAAAG